jgi:type II secretory pathway pseudopilin PulG
MTLLELLVVLAGAGILATAAFTNLAAILDRARFNAERGRLFATVRDARDHARDSFGTVKVTTNTTSIQTDVVATCGGPVVQNLDVVPMRYLTFTGIGSFCFEGVSALSATPAAVDAILAATGPNAEAVAVTVTPWAGLTTNWGEAPPEGYGAAGCDPDEDPGCGL